ncbi:MAG TPA: M20/M25/M40 family metallo-hydrolase, partial [Candidatus Binatia bacterium]|nr:M20/M25/M40 family metallo-hydrolase [Candidatus Binatia bacterium]
MDQNKLTQFVERLWDQEALPLLAEYIKIPNKSPEFDADWAKHGHMEKAVDLLTGWARQKIAGFAGATLEVLRLPERTPLIVIDIPATGKNTETVLLYGHLDKQPEMVGWADGMGPWIPVRQGDKLYGRGGADDGYAIFAALASIGALRDQGIPHARAVVLIEASEESGSPDLPHYIDHLAPRLGTPSLVVCLDSGCANYDQLWVTTSLRGLWNGTITIRVLEEGVHSGSASGIVPSSFRIFRQLLSRLEDE